MTQRLPATPSKPVLLGLIGAVLGLHLWLLAGGLPMTGGPTPPAGAHPLPAHPADAPSAPAAEGGAVAPPPQAMAVQVSAVRWVVPSVTPPATPAPPRQTVTPPRTEPLRDEIAVHVPQPPPEDPEPLQDTVATTPPSPVDLPTPTETPLSEAPAPPSDAAASPSEAPPPPAEETLLAMAPTSPPRPVTATPSRATAAASVPPSMVLLYDVQGRAKSLPYSAEAVLQWQQDGARYSATLEIKAFLVGSRVQSSRGRLGPQGLIPERFGDKRRNTEKAAHFDWAGQRIRFSSNAPDAPLLPGAQDRLSVFLQLAALLQGRPEAYAQGLSLPVAGTGSAEEWVFQMGHLQTLSLPAGAVSARQLTRLPRHEHDSRVDIWLAPELQYLPVRIRVTEADGSHADQLLRQLPPLVR